MKRQTVIIMTRPGDEPICRGNLKKLCEEMGWSYSTLSKKRLPLEHEGFTIYRVEFI